MMKHKKNVHELYTTDILGVVHVVFTLFSRRVSEVEAAETRAELRQAEQKVISPRSQKNNDD
jgi:hypothetical protein